MKKYLLYILLILLSFKSFAQPIVHRSNGSITVSDERLRAGLNLFIPQFRDTASASAERGIDSAGAIIYTMLDHNFWLRNLWPKKWTQISIGENPIIPTWQQTLSATNGNILTKKDTVNINGHNLLIQNGSVDLLRFDVAGNFIYGTDAYFGNGWITLGGAPQEATISLQAVGGIHDVQLSAPYTTGDEHLFFPNISGYLGIDHEGTMLSRVNQTVGDHTGTVVLPLIDSIWRTDRDSIHFRQWEPGLGGSILKAILDQTSNITGLITAGTNVTISGTGTAADPYIINSSGGGGGGSPNVNIGAGFRLAQVFTNNIKTLGGGVGMLLDSTTTTNVITFKADTVTLATRGRLYKVADSVSKLVTLQQAIINGATFSQDNNINAANHNFMINDLKVLDFIDHATVERFVINSSATTITGPSGGTSSQVIIMDTDSLTLKSQSLTAPNVDNEITLKKDSIIFRPHLGQLNIDSLRTATNLTGHRVLVWNYLHGNVESISVDSLKSSSSGFYDFPVRNGLQVIDGGSDVDTLLLGGTLTQNTTLDANSLYSFRIDSTTTFQVTKRSDEDFGVGQILLDDNFGWIKYTNNIHTTTGIITATEEAASISASAPGVASSMSVDAGYAEISATDSFTIKNNHVAIRYLPKSVDTANKIVGINPLSGRLVYLPWLGGGGGGSFINNGTSQQTSANFNIDGNGTLGGSIFLPNSTTTKAALYLNSVPFFSNYGVDHDNISVLGGSLNTNNYNKFNVSIGSLAGIDNNSGQSIFIGYAAGRHFKTDDSTSFPGVIAIGVSAMQDATSHYNRDNIAIGPNTMQHFLYGFSNIAIGKITAQDLDSGTANTLVGASINLKHGGYNTGMGTDIGVGGFIGDNNVLLGSYAMQSAVNITENVAIGYSAGTSNTNGGYNTYVGPRSGYYELGSDNIMLGNYAGVNLADHTLSNILFIGSETTGNATILGDMSTRRVGINFIDPTAISYTLHVGGTFGVNTMPLAWDTTATKIVTYNTSTHQYGQTNWNNSASGGGVTTMAAIGSSPNANGASISSVTLTLQPASASFGGVVTTTTQHFAGSKIFDASPSAPFGTNSERFGGSATGTGTGQSVFGYNPNVGDGDYNTGFGAVGSIPNGLFHVTAVGGSYVAASSNSTILGYALTGTAGWNGQIVIGASDVTPEQVMIGFGNTGGFINIGSGNNYGTNTTSWMIGNGLTVTDQNQLLIGNTDNGWAPNNVYIGQGVTHANASTYAFLNIHATGGSGTNDAGADFALYAGQGTGSAAGGKFSIYTTPTGSSGTTLNSAVERFKIAADGTISLLTTPATSAGTYDVLSRNTSTGIVEKITSATFIKQGSNTLSTNFTIDGASSTYTVTLSNILGLLVTSSSGNIQQGATNTLQANTGANFILGGAVISRALKTSNATLTINEHYIAVDATSGNITLTMPTNAAMGGATYSYVIKRIDNSGNTVTINAASSQTLDGAGSTTLASLQSKTLNFDGTNNFEIN